MVLQKLTLGEKRRLVNDLVAGLHEGLVERLPKIPEHWDAAEIRMWVGDFYASQYGAPQMSAARQASYDNDIVTLNIT